MKIRKTGFMIAACLIVSQAYADTSAALAHILDEMHAPSDQVTRLREAIESSPALEAQLNTLAASGRLTEFVVSDDANLPPKTGPFSAWIHGATWAFQTSFIGQHGKRRLNDVVMPDDILPDNLVFALGHLAYKAQTAKEMNAETASGQHLSLQQWKDLRINNEAAATIQAWNDTVDAAEQENGGRHLSVRQAFSLLINLQYRVALLKAIQAPADSRLNMANDGSVEMTSANVSAVAKALSSSGVFDVQ